MVYDTETDQLTEGIYTRREVEMAAMELNHTVCPMEMDEDGVTEYADEPQRYKPVRVTIEEIE